MAKKLTRKDATILGLEVLGFSRDDDRSRKYIAFHCPNRLECYLVGKAGALRKVSLGQPISKSRSLTGNRCHTAFEFVGRTANDQPNLPLKTLSRLYVQVLDRDIYPAKFFKEMA